MGTLYLIRMAIFLENFYFHSRKQSPAKGPKGNHEGESLGRLLSNPDLRGSVRWQEHLGCGHRTP